MASELEADVQFSFESKEPIGPASDSRGCKVEASIDNFLQCLFHKPINGSHIATELLIETREQVL